MMNRSKDNLNSQGNRAVHLANVIVTAREFNMMVSLTIKGILKGWPHPNLESMTVMEDKIKEEENLNKLIIISTNTRTKRLEGINLATQANKKERANKFDLNQQAQWVMSPNSREKLQKPQRNALNMLLVLSPNNQLSNHKNRNKD